MNGIPEDVMKAAHGLYWRLFTVDDEANNPPADVKHDIEIIARAIMDERERCSEIVRKAWGSNTSIDLMTENFRLKANLAEARDKAMEDARLVVTGWRERDWPEGFNRVTAQHMADVLEEVIRAMKSTEQEPKP